MRRCQEGCESPQLGRDRDGIDFCHKHIPADLARFCYATRGPLMAPRGGPPICGQAPTTAIGLGVDEGWLAFRCSACAKLLIEAWAKQYGRDRVEVLQLVRPSFDTRSPTGRE